MSISSVLSATLACLNLAFDASVVFFVAWAATSFVRSNSSVRHAIWGTAFATVLLLPFLGLVNTVHKSVPIEIPVAASPLNRASIGSSAMALSSHSTPQLARDPHYKSAFNWPLAAKVLLGSWAIGSTALLTWTLFALIGLTSLRRSSKPTRWGVGEWERLSRQIELDRPVQLRTSTGSAPISAMTWGTFRPVILLPQDAENWTPEQRELIVLHELAHVKRFDCLFQLLATLVCAFFWFHPVVWLASALMRAEAEMSADDAVIGSGVRATDYAANLVTLAALFGAAQQPRNSLGVFMMKRSGIESRVRSIIDPSRRRHGATTTQVIAIVAVALFAGFFLATIRPVLIPLIKGEDPLYESALYSMTARQRSRHELVTKLQSATKSPVDEGSASIYPLVTSKAEPTWRKRLIAQASARATAFRTKLLAERQRMKQDHLKAEANTSLAEHSGMSEGSVAPSSLTETIPTAAKHSPVISWDADKQDRTLHGPVSTSQISARATQIGAMAAQIGDTAKLSAMLWTMAAPLAVKKPLVIQRLEPIIAPKPPVPLALDLSAKSPSEQNLPPYHAVEASGGVRLTLRVGPSQSSGVTCSPDRQTELAAHVDHGVLHVTGGPDLTVVATTPSLDDLHVSGNSAVVCRGVNEYKFRIVVDGQSQAILTGHATVFNITVSGSSSLDAGGFGASLLHGDISGASSEVLGGNFSEFVLNVDGTSSAVAHGRTDRLVITGKGASSIDLSRMQAKTVVADAEGATRMIVNASSSLTATARGNGGIIYKGHPRDLHTTTDAVSSISK